MSQSLIRATLMSALATYANAHNPVLSIARENTSFVKPTTGATFLEAFIIPANTITTTVSADHRRFYGDLQINIWTKQGVGAGTAETIAEEIAQMFKVGTKNFSPVRIAAASIRRSLEDASNWWVTPIQISYQMDADS